MTIPRNILLLAAFLATTTILVTGCDAMSDSDRPTTQQETEDAARKLQQRPNLEDAEAQVQQVMDQIAAAATNLAPTLQFEWIDDRTTPSCDKPFDRTNGRKVYMRNLWARAPFPEDQWPTFFTQVRDLAATVGATWVQPIRDEIPTSTPTTVPSPEFRQHDVNFFNPETGTTIRVGTDKATIISATVGCHLPKDKFDNPIRPTS